MSKETPEIRLIKDIVKAINWQNKRLYEIEKLVKYLVKQELGLNDSDDTNDEGENADDENGDIDP